MFENFRPKPKQETVPTVSENTTENKESLENQIEQEAIKLDANINYIENLADDPFIEKWSTTDEFKRNLLLHSLKIEESESTIWNTLGNITDVSKELWKADEDVPTKKVFGKLLAVGLYPVLATVGFTGKVVGAVPEAFKYFRKKKYENELNGLNAKYSNLSENK